MESFKGELLRCGQRILIYGAGGYGEIALRSLEMEGMTIFGFIDRNESFDSIYGFPVFLPSKLEDFTEDCILIASDVYFFDMANYAEAIGCKYIYSIVDIIQKDMDISQLSNRAKEKYFTKNNYISVATGTLLTIAHMCFSIGTKCTLKCKDCAALMPYYDKPYLIDISKYRRAFDRFLDAIDYIGELKVYGGEVFLNPDLDYFLSVYGKNNKIGNISLYTNGMVIPEQRIIESIKENQKVRIHISNYGKCNKEHIDKLIEFLKKNKITYFLRTYDSWQRLGGLRKRERTDDETADVYHACYAKRCNHFLKGKFYVCARQGHSIELGATENNNYEYVDFNSEYFDKDKAQKSIIDLLYNRKYLEACRHCDGMFSSGNEVQAAIQAKNILNITD